MFGPTFANLGNLQTENAIIIKESDHMGKIFFKDLYGSLKLNVCEYTFEGTTKSWPTPSRCRSPRRSYSPPS